MPKKRAFLCSASGGNLFFAKRRTITVIRSGSQKRTFQRDYGFANQAEIAKTNSSSCDECLKQVAF